MSKKDIISKQIIKRLAVDIAVYLLHLDINPDDVELIDTEKHRIEDRRADLVVKLAYRNQAHFILHVEIQNSNDKTMPLRMLRYYTDIALQYPELPIEQYVIYIGKQALTMPARLNTKDWYYCYRLIDMRSIDSAIFIAQDNPDALVLALLCDFKDRDAQEMVNYIVLRLQELFENDSKQFHDYFMMLDILSDNRDLQQQVKRANEMLTQMTVEKSSFYQIGLERGVLKGIEKGIEQGIEKGIEQGIEEGKFLEKQALAKTMLQEGFDLNVIAKLTGLSKVEIAQLSS